MEGFHLGGQKLCKFIRTKENVLYKKRLNSRSIGLEHQHGCRFNVLGQQYGECDVI